MARKLGDAGGGAGAGAARGPGVGVGAAAAAGEGLEGDGDVGEWGEGGVAGGVELYIVTKPFLQPSSDMPIAGEALVLEELPWGAPARLPVLISMCPSSAFLGSDAHRLPAANTFAQMRSGRGPRRRWGRRPTGRWTRSGHRACTC